MRTYRISASGGSENQSRHVVNTSGSACAARTNSVVADQHTTAIHTAWIACRSDAAGRFGAERSTTGKRARSAALALVLAEETLALLLRLFGAQVGAGRVHDVLGFVEQPGDIVTEFRGLSAGPCASPSVPYCQPASIMRRS